MYKAPQSINRSTGSHNQKKLIVVIDNFDYIVEGKKGGEKCKVGIIKAFINPLVPLQDPFGYRLLCE